MSLVTETLTSKTMRGIKWSYASTVTNAVMQIGYTAVMARLLDPKAFGLVAMAGVVLRFGSYFAQMGMGQAIIQKKEVTNEDIRAAFTSSILLSAFFLLLVWILAPFAVLIFDNTEVIPIIRVMAFSFVLTGLSTTSLALIKRNLKFKALAVIEIISYIIGYAGVGVTFAYSGFGVWSLVFASLAQAFISGLLSYLVVRHNLLFLFNWKTYKPLFAFGSRVSVISFFEFIGASLDTLFIGRILGASKLGIYNRAFMLINLPMNYFVISSSRVLFPSISKIQKNKDRLRDIYLSTIKVMGVLLFAICFSMSVAAHQIVIVILGPKWIEAIPILRVLAFAIPFDFLSHFGGITCDATANLNPKLILQISYIIILFLLFYFFSSIGLIGFAIALVIAQIIKNMGYIFITKKLLKYSLKEILYSYYPAILGGIIVAATVFLTLIFAQIYIASQIILLFICVFAGSISLLFFLFSNKSIKAYLEINILNNFTFYIRLKKIFGET